MPELDAIVENTPSSQTLCQLELWPPAQGSVPEAVPLSVDLDFDVENVRFHNASFEIRARKAMLHLNMIDADLVRGSRLGEHVIDPHMVADVTQSVRLAIETETGAEGRIEVEVKPNIFGRLVGSVFWKKRKSKKAEHDHIVKSSMRVSRIIPRTAGRWAIVEPVNPHLLSGRFIGSAGEKEIGPLCLLTMRAATCLTQIVVSAKREDLSVSQVGQEQAHTRNKEAVIAQMARRSISSNQVTDFELPPSISNNDIILARSVMEISVENE